MRRSRDARARSRPGAPRGHPSRGATRRRRSRRAGKAAVGRPRRGATRCRSRGRRFLWQWARSCFVSRRARHGHSIFASRPGERHCSACIAEQRRAMVTYIDAPTLKSWLSDGSEIALIDVREAGQFGEAHPFFAIPLPYSRFGPSLWRLVPSPAVRLVLCDAGDGVAERAAKRAETLGYRDIYVLRGGAPAWAEAGYTLYAGVNVPSKTFGELVEHQRHTPHISAQELQAMRAAGDNIVIVDGRTFAEYQRMNIPDGISCPNGELALRIQDIAPDPKTKIVVNCAGRTRSIIGAQTLIDFGVPNPVVALENGTQGWFLAGLELERGANRRYPHDAGSRDQTALAALAVRARALAQRHGVGFVTVAQADEWWRDRTRTTYFFDIRLEGEWRLAPDWAYFFQSRLEGEWPLLPGFVHAPGGQLIQATDQWVGVKGARLVLGDEELVRAPVVASWLRQLGHEAYVLEGGLPKVAPVP